MSKFFVSPTTETDLEMAPEVLSTALLREFPGIQIENVSSGNRLLLWNLVAKHGPLEGYLNRKKQVVVLDGDVRDCAEFAQWYRNLVDSRYELAFYDDSYSNNVSVTELTTARNLSSPWLNS